ncbi:MAG: hypothetical protein IPK96_17955 [Flammeovirgaceae bacterium]|nr:hypothetical protein [Flammeovirgaceae bacterium]
MYGSGYSRYGPGDDGELNNVVNASLAGSHAAARRDGGEIGENKDGDTGYWVQRHYSLHGELVINAKFIPIPKVGQQTQGGSATGNPPGLPLGVVETSLMSGGITLPGIGIFVEPNSGNLTKHEVGHYLQFLRDDGSYFKFYKNIGAPSLYNAIEQTFVKSVLGIDPSKVGLSHDNFRTETDANILMFGPEGHKYYPTETKSSSLNWYQRLDVYINILWNTR